MTLSLTSHLLGKGGEGRGREGKGGEGRGREGKGGELHTTIVERLRASEKQSTDRDT